MNQGAYVITKFDPLSIILQECPRAGELLAEVDEMIDEINQQLDKEWQKEQKKAGVIASEAK
jgi:hypothetical protein